VSVVLHIGLHRTATTFLQAAVFPQIDAGDVVVDPRPISRHLGPLFFRLDYGLLSETDIDRFAERLDHARRATAPCRWLLSNETLSQNMYLLNFEAHIRLLARLFPDAQIILMLRFQPDWFLSAYKQLMSVGDIQSISDFLGYRDGAFRTCQALDISGKCLPHTNALALRYDQMIRLLFECFGQQRVHVFFYENFKKNTEATLAAMSEIVGTPLRAPRATPKVNRSLSAMACTWSTRRRDVLRAALPGLPFGDCRTARHHRCRQRELECFLYGDERSAARDRPRDIDTPLRLLGWRFWMQEVLDRVVYNDWDMLTASGLREPLTAHYLRVNNALIDLLGADNIPAPYTGASRPVTAAAD
jgi:hypothetical protein